MYLFLDVSSHKIVGWQVYGSEGATMLATMQKLGVMPSFSSPAASDDNPYIGPFFGTLKYAPAYPGRFAGITAARTFMAEFAEGYNPRHPHSGIRYVTPAQRPAGADVTILRQRKAVYECAKANDPERWNNRPTRNWNPIREVHLNPAKAKTQDTVLAEAA